MPHFPQLPHVVVQEIVGSIPVVISGPIDINNINTLQTIVNAVNVDTVQTIANAVTVSAINSPQNLLGPVGADVIYVSTTASSLAALVVNMNAIVAANPGKKFYGFAYDLLGATHRAIISREP